MPSDPLINWLFGFVRVSALLTVMPLFSALAVPVPLRVALAALTALLIAPLLPPMAALPADFFGWIRAFFVEASVGVLLGFICRLVFYAAELGGGIIANEMGLTMSTSFNPMGPNSTPIPGLILFWMATLIFLGLDLHHWVLAAFQQSYTLVPIGGASLPPELFRDVMGQSSRIFVIALQIAAPLMAVSFLLTMVFAVLGRAVPQMNVFQESFTVRTLVGLLSFGLTCTLMGQHLANHLRRLPDDFIRVARLLGAG
jgi:flagellar biosynthetic protein FliR